MPVPKAVVAGGRPSSPTCGSHTTRPLADGPRHLRAAARVTACALAVCQGWPPALSGASMVARMMRTSPTTSNGQRWVLIRAAQGGVPSIRSLLWGSFGIKTGPVRSLGEVMPSPRSQDLPRSKEDKLEIPRSRQLQGTSCPVRLVPKAWWIPRLSLGLTLRWCHLALEHAHVIDAAIAVVGHVSHAAVGYIACARACHSLRFAAASVLPTMHASAMCCDEHMPANSTEHPAYMIN